MKMKEQKVALDDKNGTNVCTFYVKDLMKNAMCCKVFGILKKQH